MPSLSRRRFLGVIGTGALAGCSSVGQPTATQTRTPTGATPANSQVPTADRRLSLPEKPASLSERATSGGPDRDGIPSIDDPTFISADEADFLDPGDPVFGVALNGEVKAYPQSILVSHEIVNDRLGERPVAITYCPLTGTAMGFGRGGTTFGVSGRLLNNNLVMYDRATETWWPQLLATSVPGPWNNDPAIASLREIRLHWTTFQRWTDRHPETRVLSRRTGYAFNYATDPYGAYNPPRGYYADRSTLFARLNPDDRFHPKAVVVGARTPDGAIAFRLDSLASDGLMRGTLDETPVVAVHDPRLNSAYVYRDPAERVVGLDGDRVRTADNSTHTPSNLPLERVYAFEAMWFAWSGFYPETSVYA